MNWQHRTMISPIALAEPARAACMALTGSASEGLFTTLLYPEGGAEATHAISSGYIAGEFADLLPCGDQPGNTEALMDLLAGVDFPITGEQLTGMLAMIDISDEDADTAIARLGLTLVPDDGTYESPLNLAPISDER